MRKFYLLLPILFSTLLVNPSFSQDLSFGIPFTVGDGVASIDLTVGVDPNGSSTDFVSGLDQLAPPAPPDGAFDARVK
ncbi:MAG: hypothetical protein ACO363_07725, partial [Balneolaceae bacterium]